MYTALCRFIEGSDFLFGVNDIFNGIYGKADYPVIVYSVSGELQWLNANAERFSEDDLRTVFAEISTGNADSGSIGFAYGGKYRLAEVGGSEFFIAELFRENAALRILNDLNASGFIQYSDMLIRQAVTGISASCEIINGISEINECEEAELCLDNIMKSCCRLMRGALLSSQLAAAVDTDCLRPAAIELNSFLSELAVGCRNAFGGKYEVRYTGGCKCIVSADRNLLTCFLLVIIRQLVGYGNERNFSISISSEKRGNIAVISFADVPEKFLSDPRADIFARLIGDINTVFAEKLNAVCSVSGNCLNISMQCDENSSEAVLESDKIFFNDSLFSPYNIMLNDLTDFRAFY